MKKHHYGKRGKFDKTQAGFLKLNKQQFLLPMEFIKQKLLRLRDLLKEGDNYLTSITDFVGAITVILITFIIALVVFPDFTGRILRGRPTGITSVPIPTATPVPTPTPRPIKQGPEAYSISTRSNPQMRELKINEFDPKKGQTQEMKAAIIDTKGASVVSVELKLITDKKTKIYPFKLTSGTPNKGEWSGSWVTDDSHDYIYTASFTVKNDKGEAFNTDLSFR